MNVFCPIHLAGALDIGVCRQSLPYETLDAFLTFSVTLDRFHNEAVR
jgi:hypothetical protein